MKEKLQGYKTKTLATVSALIALLQVFNITSFTEEQITAIMTLLASGIALSIYDRISRESK